MKRAHGADRDAAPRRSSVPPSQPIGWDEQDVGAWLNSLGLGDHAPAFANSRVNGRLLLSLDDEDLQAELGVVVSRGLMSEQRQQWLDAKAELEEKKRECTQKWARLQSSHADAADAWKQLAEHAGEKPERSGRGRKARRKERKARRKGSSLLASKELGVPTIFAKTPARLVKVPAFAVRDLCASPGRVWWLPAARRPTQAESCPPGT